LKAALIDFRDSFTFNIAHYLEAEGVELEVFDHLSIDYSSLAAVDFIVLSPGPGLPHEKKALGSVMERFSAVKPILGICLGMQGIVQFFGGQIYNQEQVRHGVQTSMKILLPDSVFNLVSTETKVGLYHSWACEIEEVKELIPLAISSDGVLMALRHRTLLIYGFQFHPESVLTESGRQMIRNFVELVKLKRND